MNNAPSKQLHRTRYTFVKEAWIRLRGCYHDAKDLLPSAIICAHCADEGVNNCTVLESPPPPGRSILVVLEPLPVENSVPEEEVLDGEIFHLGRTIAGGTYGMRSEHLRAFL